MKVGDIVTVMIARVSGGDVGMFGDRVGISFRKGRARIAIELTPEQFGLAITGVLVEGKVTGTDYQ